MLLRTESQLIHLESARSAKYHFPDEGGSQGLTITTLLLYLFDTHDTDESTIKSQ